MLTEDEWVEIWRSKGDRDVIERILAARLAPYREREADLGMVCDAYGLPHSAVALARHLAANAEHGHNVNMDTIRVLREREAKALALIRRAEDGHRRWLELEPEDAADHARWYHARFGAEEPLTVRVSDLRAVFDTPAPETEEEGR